MHAAEYLGTPSVTVAPRATVRFLESEWAQAADSGGVAGRGSYLLTVYIQSLYVDNRVLGPYAHMLREADQERRDC